VVQSVRALIVKRVSWFKSSLFSGFQSYTHNNYNYIMKLSEVILIRKVFTTEEEAPSKLGLGFG
jgi:hypothetical protein